MSSIRFLFDENVPPTILQFLQQTEPQIQAYSIGDGVAPSRDLIQISLIG